MDKQKLNSLVVSYKGGNELSLNEIFNTIQPLIEKAVTDISGFVDDTTKFECRMLLKAKRLAETFDERKHKSFYGAVKAVISKEKTYYLKKKARECELLSLDLMESSDGDERAGYQFEDGSANVERDVLFKEKISLLAQGDSRKEIILSEWSKGVKDDKSIAMLLAQQYGGSIETHRSFLYRFRTKCQSLLLKADVI